MRALLSAGVYVDEQDELGCSPLSNACIHGHLDVVQALLSAGAAVNLRDKMGHNALSAAFFQWHTEVIHALHLAGARVGPGISPLLAACRSHSDDTACALLAAWALEELQNGEEVDSALPPLHLKPA